ncbi:hypothetical protein GAYE_SCF28MG4762 [Galdieria yellowstonensis]|uniref:DNA-directed RNA polymerase subunit n=1 Tax=Galdieria yellowstonensis TaxID=3028027 RepID=A0AAV9IHP0_9RHOD|nr:hypothetical protein GAYE_SCF28MG4762 [Galdieria yellowstonensis]
MLFCRWCHNLLLLERQQDSYRFVCRTCPFYYQVEGKMERKLFGLQKKQEADVLGGDKQWELADQTDAMCPRCSHQRAYFFQMQTRSADEPMSTFYRCVECGHQWKEN